MATAPFGTLYLAEASKTDRVLVRLLPSRFGASEAVMQALAGLCATASRSDWFVRTLQVGITSEGAPFLLSEHFEGQTLWGYVSGEGSLNVADALKVGIDIATALEHLHAEGKVHGGLAPRCVLRSPWGRTKLGDPGLVPLLESFESGSPIERINKGERCFADPVFLPPEVLSGAAPSVASDLYCLGLLLFFALTGRPAFARATTIETAHAHLLEQIEPLSDTATFLDLPPKLEELIAQLVSKQPTDRPATAREVRERLTALSRTAASRMATSFDDAPTTVRTRPGRDLDSAPRQPSFRGPTLSKPEVARRRVRARPKWLAPLLFALIALLLGVAGWLGLMVISR